MSESKYQLLLVKQIRKLLPGCYVLRNNPHDIQGIPDILVLYGRHWAMLEVKVSAKAPQQPNQEYYVKVFDDMSFAAFIFPENEEEILDALQRSFRADR